MLRFLTCYTLIRRGSPLILDVAGRNKLSAAYWRQEHFGLHAFTYSSIKKKIEALGCQIIECHVLDFCDQWKYVPGIHRINLVDHVFHAVPWPERNLDYRISNLPGLFRFAKQWYIAARKDGAL